MKTIKRTIEYFTHSIQSYFKTRIGSNYKTRQHQYYNTFTDKVWFESF